MRSARTGVWLDGAGDWAWPGTGGGEAAVELAPPPWVPALPRRALTPANGAPGAVGRRRRTTATGTLARRYGATLLLAALAAACVGLAIDGRMSIERLAGLRAAPVRAAPRASIDAPPVALPTLAPVSRDAAGSAIDTASYPSQALHGEGSFLVYLPPGYAATTARYPVVYLLHGDGESDGSFLQIGLQGTLDRLIASHAIAPAIAVMIQGGPGANNWLDEGAHDYEAYVLEVQRLVDRMLPTVATRGGRAIAGYSMGGYGAMHIALAHPRVFSAVESWLGFFNGLAGPLRADRATISRLGLRAYVYGASADTIADPSENGPFAAALRAAGADAHSAVYSGEHSLETLAAHLEHMLVFAARKLS